MKIKRRWTAIRNQTHRLLVRVADETQAVELRASRVLTTRDRLSSSRERLSTERGTKQETLASVRESKEKWLADIAALQAGSADIAARLRSGGSHSSFDSIGGGADLAGPGRAHQPLRHALGANARRHRHRCAAGNPDLCRGGGTVNYAGWEGGYGNLTLIDHGNGLATAYGHQSQFAVARGQTVSRGQLIGYVGSTGHSTGPHVHFEVRVNGAPNDPLRYLS